MHWKELMFYAAITTENEKPNEQQHHISTETVFTINYRDNWDTSEKWETKTGGNLQNRQNLWIELLASYFFLSLGKACYPLKIFVSFKGLSKKGQN